MPRPSSIDKLPEEVRTALNSWLRDAGITQAEATERTNLLLQEMGIDHRVSKSGVNRYSMRMEEVGKKLRESREVAQMWIAELGAQPQGEIGKLMNEMVRSLAFDAVMEASESETPVSPTFIKEMALSLQRLESAANMNEERDRKLEAEARRKAQEEMAESLDKAIETHGATPKTIAMWREQFLGVR